MIAEVNMYLYLKYGPLTWDIWQKTISPILLVVIALVLQFVVLKTCKRYRSEILYTGRVQ